MKNELTALEILLNDAIAQEQPEFLQHFTVACTCLKEVWLKGVFASDSPLKTREYIQYHHRAVVMLIDKIYARNLMVPEKHQACNQSILSRLDDLQAYLMVHFKPYIDLKSGIAQCELHQFKAESLKLRNSLRRLFINKGIQHNLMDVLARYFKAIANLKVLSIEMLQYHRFVFAKLTALSVHKGYRDYHDHLVLLLIRLNFNSVDFMTYCRNRMLQLIQKTEKREIQLDTLSLLLKKLRLIQLFPGLSLHADHQKINILLAEWILEEKHFIENKKIRAGVNVPDMAMEKIELGFSVSQLALFIRILVEQNMLLKSNLTKLLSFFAAAFRTQKTEKISFESLRNHYYDVDSGTISGLKTKMIGVLNALNKMRS